MGLDNVVARSVNFAGDGFEFAFSKCEKVVVPGALGAVGGWLAGIGPQLGLFQGAAAGSLYSWILKPAGQYIKKHSGDKDNEIHDNARRMLILAGVISETAIPILLTMYVGDTTMSAVSSILPTSTQWLVTPNVGKEYTWLSGLLVNIAPALVQWGIEALRSESRKED